MDRTETARAYYRALDEADYDRLAELLSPSFVHDRPDLTLEGRDRFVRFVREERPHADTTHAIDATYVADAVDATDPTDAAEATDRGSAGVAVRGRLLDGDALLVRFVDAFAFAEDGAIERVTTYTNGGTGG